MSSKICIALMGSPSLKNRFDAVFNQKDENGNWVYWRWNINPNNIINHAASFILKEIDIKEGDNVNKFIGNLGMSANRILNFKEAYVTRMVKKFLNHEKAQFLILHGLGQELTEKLRSEGLVHTVFLTEKENVEINALAEYTIVENEEFESNVLKIIGSITKE